MMRRARIAHDSLVTSGAPGLPGFDPKSPWGYIFKQAVSPSNHEATSFWTTQVKDKSLLYQCHVKNESELTKDGTVASNSTNNFYGKRPYGQSSPASWTPRPTARASRPPGKGKGSKSKGNKTDICLNFNFGRCTSPCPAGRPHTCSHCGRNGHPILSCFQCPEQENSGSSNAPTQQKEERKEKEGRKAKANELIRLLLLIPPFGNPSSSPADLTCVPRRNRRIILKPASLSPLFRPHRRSPRHSAARQVGMPRHRHLQLRRGLRQDPT